MERLFEQQNHLQGKSFSDVYKKIVNYKFDGANVISGSKSGVQMRMKELQPSFIYTHCPALQLKLAVLDSMKIDSCMKEFDANINNILKF